MLMMLDLDLTGLDWTGLDSVGSSCLLELVLHLLRILSR